MISKKSIVATLAVMATMNVATSAPISENRAQALAGQFLNRQVEQVAQARRAARAPGQSTSVAPAYYVFNAQQSGGYVIIAGDDRVPAVLAYSDQGRFDADAVPEAMQELLDGYAAQLELLDQEQLAPRLTARTPIAPLLKTHWGQSAPYNIMAPYVSGVHAPTGCVATAMAQIMYCHQYPARATTTIPSYTTSTNAIFMSSLSPVDFNWTAMADIYYSNDTTSTAAKAVATLMKYCDQALSMDFQKSVSNASTALVPFALSTYFGYKSSARYVSRLNYGTEEWEQMLYDELAAGRPVAYAGNKKSGGHAFVCDGCDANGLFHINWGWASQSDGYFVLSVLNPTAQGIGSSSGAYGYIYNQAMAIGLEPGTEPAETLALTSTRFTLDDAITTRTAYSGSFQVTVSNRFFNYTSQVASFNLGYGLYKDGVLQTKLYSSYTTNLKPSRYIGTTSRTLSFGANLSSGTYRIVPIYSIYNANDWHPCLGTDNNYIEVTISGNTCTVKGYGTAATPSYTVNDVTFEGTLHPGKAVNVTANVTNNGDSRYDLVYLFLDGTFTSTAQPDLNKGETGDIGFRFVPTEAGSYTVTISLNDDGTKPIATRTLVISPMDTALLAVEAQVLNITDAENKIITSNRFALDVAVQNAGEIAYDEDIAVRLYRVTHDNYGNSIHTQSQRLQLAAGETDSLHFEFDELIDGYKYFAWVYYYSGGELISAKGTGIYTMQLPTEPVNPDPDPEQLEGDLNHDGAVDVSDVNYLINLILKK
ncbi:MAG: C10 family peptidase [Muribaculaceae bacterium]|nr:C10 family peptidase [Muribaculaceae bacterium]